MVERVHAAWGSFGSWLVEVSRGPETAEYHAALSRQDFDAAGPAVLRCVWDGKERVLSLLVGHTPPLSAPTGFQSIRDSQPEDALSAMDDALGQILAWAAGNA